MVKFLIYGFMLQAYQLFELVKSKYSLFKGYWEISKPRGGAQMPAQR